MAVFNKERDDYVRFAYMDLSVDRECYWLKFNNTRQLRSALKCLSYEITSRYSPLDLKVIWFDFGSAFHDCICNKNKVPAPHVISMLADNQNVDDCLSRLMHMQKYTSSMMAKHEDILTEYKATSYINLLAENRKACIQAIRGDARYFPKVLVLLNNLGSNLTENQMRTLNAVMLKVRSCNMQIVVTEIGKHDLCKFETSADMGRFEVLHEDDDNIRLSDAHEGIIRFNKVSSTDLYAKVDSALLSAHMLGVPRNRITKDFSYKVLYDV